MKKTVLPLLLFAISLLICAAMSAADAAKAADSVPTFDYLHPQALTFTFPHASEQNFSVNGKQLKPHQYSYDAAGGDLILHTSYLYTLSPGDFTLAGGGTSCSFNVIRSDNISLSDAFNVHGWDEYGAWERYQYDGIEYANLDIYALKEFSLESIWGLTVNSNNYDAWVKMPRDINTSQAVALALPLNSNTKYNITVRTSRSSGQYLFSAYNNFIDIDGAQISGSGAMTTSFTAASCNKIYFVLAHFNWGDSDSISSQLAISIVPISHKVTFITADGMSIEQNIPQGMKAHCPPMEGITWFKDEALSTAFDFDSPIVADTVLYGGESGLSKVPGASAVPSDADTLTIKLDGSGGADSFQYWIQAATDKDGVFSAGDNRYRWYNLSAYIPQQQHSFALLDSYCIDGYYNVLVRAKQGEDLVWEQLYRFSKQSAGIAVINYIQIDDKPLSVSGANILSQNSIISVGFDATLLKLYIDGEQALQSTDGKFDVSKIPPDFFDLSGNTNITITAENEYSIDSITFSGYFEESFNADTAIIVQDFYAQKDGEGNVLFYADIGYVSGTDIDEDVLQKITLQFSVNGKSYKGYTIIPSEKHNTITVMYRFTPGGTGVLFANISLYSGQKKLDYYQFYYRGNTSDASLSVTANTFDAQLQQDFLIEAQGEVNGNSDVLYAFYREDAAGYTLLRSFCDNPKFTFRPALPGTYRIAVRVMAKTGSISYELQVDKLFTVFDDHPIYNQEKLSLTLSSDADDAADYTAHVGSAYVLKAHYQGGDRALYKYLIYTPFTQGIYISSYSVSGELVFFFNKPGTYVFTVRVVDYQRYGYADSYKSITVMVS